MNRSFRIPRRRRGVTSVIAMLFLVLIGTLALGFYTSVTTATALAKNDRRSAKALMAAESGIQFMRNRLANVSIPPNTTAADLLDELEADLLNDEQIANNLLGTPIPPRDGNVLTIPFICTDVAEQSGFTVTISDIGAVGEIVCTVRGQSGDAKTGAVSNKSVRLDFTRKEIESNVFESAIAAQSQFVMRKGSVTGIPNVSSDSIIKLMSAQETYPAIIMYNGKIGSLDGGELGTVIPDPDPMEAGEPLDGALQFSQGYVHGSQNPLTIKENYLKLVDKPEFPTVNTDMFVNYATSTYTGGTGGVLRNVRIPAGTNPKFTGNVTIQGILYVESPNVVDFGGNTNMQGFIVFQNAGNSTVNQINATGNFTYGNLPDDTEFDKLRTITGISMLAPTTAVKFSGSVDSQIRGNMILGRFENAGSADIQIEKGSILALDPSGTGYPGIHLNGKTVKFASTGADFPPSEGVSYTSRFLPTKGSYLELN